MKFDPLPRQRGLVKLFFLGAVGFEPWQAAFLKSATLLVFRR
jgi:hypothetical protein